MAWDQDVKDRAQANDPEIWKSYSGKTPQEKARIDQLRIVSLHKARGEIEAGIPAGEVEKAPEFGGIPMRIVCPDCGGLHLDEGEWQHKPHHTHACQHCGNVWRPAVENTTGVRFLPGFRNEVE